MSEASSNRRVVKNTLLLYVRMFITMTISVWTSRIVLNALGFTDQGLYNVVGGFVGFSSIITGSIPAAFSVFLTLAIGENDITKANRIIQNATTVQWILVAVVLIFAETIGLWFLNNRLIIPENRLFAVNVVYQLSLGGFIIALMSSAYRSLLMAYEKINVFAGVSIANAVVLLGMAFTIECYENDRLILYSLLQFFVAIYSGLFYFVYCRRKFTKIKIKFGFDKKIFKPIFNFAGWDSLGNFSSILRSSGTSVLLNIYGGPIANTINGISNSVNNIVTIFVNDFTTAYSPQITKKYAAGEYDSFLPFLYQCSKFSFILLAVVAIPIFFNIEQLLIIWLKNIPNETVIFARLIIINSLIECVSSPLIKAKNATGNVKNYQIIVAGILLMTLPLSYLFLKIGLPIWWAYISIVLTSCFTFIARMVMLKGVIKFWSISGFIKTVVVRCMIATVLSAFVSLALYKYLPNDFISVLLQCVLGFLFSCICMYFVVCNNYERKAILKIVRHYMAKVVIKDNK